LKRTKILHLIASTGMGGAERVLIDICTSLRNSRFQFEAAIFKSPGKSIHYQLAEALQKRGVPVHYITMNAPLYTHAREILKIARLMARADISILHCHGSRANVIGALAAKMSGIPVVSTVHGWITDSRKMMFYKWLDLKALKHHDRLLPVSEKLRNELLGHHIDTNRLTILRNIPPAGNGLKMVAKQTAGAKDVLHLGYVGRISKEKGIECLLTAMKTLSSRKSYRLHVIGDGPERQSAEQRVQEWGLENQVCFHGYVSDIERYYRMLDVLILPSFTEGTPLVVLEAMTFGLAIIATRVGGIPEILADGENGIIINPGSADELAAAIAYLLDNQERIDDLGTNAIQRVAALCSRDEWERTLCTVYSSLLELHGKHDRGGNEH